MKTLNPYLVFDGNCREAMSFYKDCLNGEIIMMETFGESPVEVAEAARERIYNSVVIADDIKIMASDNMPDAETEKGKNFSMFVIFSDESEMKTVFEKLLDGGGEITFPLENGFGMLTDKYGIQWMVTIH